MASEANGGGSRISASGPIVAFILAGKTGSGKSSFIKLVGGKEFGTGEDPVVSGALDSCTTKPTLYIATLASREILLLDTPGFDDSAVGNLEILNEIVASLYMFALQPREINTQGVIFLHDIGETRFAGSQRKTLELLKAMVGEKAMKNVVIGTTMWSSENTPKYNNEVKREREFMTKHWRGIFKTTRIPYEDQNVALEIISDMLARPPCLLLAQEEMLKPPHTCEETTVGKIAIPEGRRELERQRQEFEEEMKRSKEEAAARDEEHRRTQEELVRAMAEDRAKNDEEAKKRDEEWAAREAENQRRHQEVMQNVENENRRTLQEQESRRNEEVRIQKEQQENMWKERNEQEKEEARKRDEEWAAREAENQRRHQEGMKNMEDKSRQELQEQEDRRNREAILQKEESEKMWNKMREQDEQSAKKRDGEWAAREADNKRRHQEAMQNLGEENRRVLQQQENQRINDAKLQREETAKMWKELKEQQVQSLKFQQEQNDKRYKEDCQRRDEDAKRIAEETRLMNDRLMKELETARQPPPPPPQSKGRRCVIC
ncbi:hypothetical protein Q9L58_008543 [Maublancomyces gigas]|uniref:AIG1-type G domain-containing protein n=1 Tax=Discina gigas TaxID=1032678 RepID=A0ABR3G9S3_9PEZI